MNELIEYEKVLNECFDKPPKNVPDVWVKLIAKHPVSIVSVQWKKQKIGFATVTMLSDNVFGIEWVVVSPAYQGMGYGTKLIQKIHSMFKGVFFVKTKDASGFYKKMGYKEIYENNSRHILSYANGLI